MLIESTTVNTAGSQGAVTPERIQQLQSELEQFIAATTARLNALSLAMSEHDERTDASQPSPAPAPDMASAFGEQVETETVEESVEPTSIAIEPLQIPEVESSEPEPEPSQSHPPETDATSLDKPVDGDEPVDPDEAWARLSAIKSRLARQLENQ